MAKIDLGRAPVQEGSGYPAPFHEMAAARTKWKLGDAGGLSDFGVNLVELPPDGWSSQRHWHESEDEFVCVLAGELVLVTDEGETVMRAGDCAAFPKGVDNAHHLINRSGAPAVYLEVGTRLPQASPCHYPDVDMAFDPARGGYLRKDGTPYPKRVCQENL